MNKEFSNCGCNEKCGIENAKKYFAGQDPRRIGSGTFEFGMGKEQFEFYVHSDCGCRTHSPAYKGGVFKVLYGIPGIKAHSIAAPSSLKSNNPYDIVRMFENEVAAYTGAPYAVSVDSCTNALFLCLQWMNWQEEQGIKVVTPYEEPCRYREIKIPRRTYLSVPQSIMHAGFTPILEELIWEGEYQLKPFPIWDSAKRFTSNMYRPGQFQCLSFHIKKHLKLGKGGMILTDNEEAVKWFKKARYEGRSEGYQYHDDDVEFIGWNMYMTPQQAAHGLALMQNFPKDNPNIPENPPYKNLDEFKAFKNLKIYSKK